MISKSRFPEKLHQSTDRVSLEYQKGHLFYTLSWDKRGNRNNWWYHT